MAPILKDVETLKIALVGTDLRHGMAADITTMKTDLAEIKKFINGEKKEQKKKGRDWRMLGFVIGASVISGVVVTAFSYVLHVMHWAVLAL
jgi:hypothetical protein